MNIFTSTRQNYTESPNFSNKAIMAALAGSAGAFVGTPAEVALVRMTSDGRLPPSNEPIYTMNPSKDLNK